MDHLIIVCCHAIWNGGAMDNVDEADEMIETSWVIEPFQKGETPTFIQHIDSGLDILKRDARAMLVFSGGATKRPRTGLCEGRSYKALAAKRLGSEYTSLESRILTEDFATDSYQNLLFSILLFRKQTLGYPHHITIVSHAFKRDRFLNIHCKSIGWPLDKICYVGINPPEEITAEGELNENEAKAVAAWREDLYGTRHELASKRVKRGWGPLQFEEERLLLHDGDSLEKSVCNLLRYDGGSDGQTLFPEALPWNS